MGRYDRTINELALAEPLASSATNPFDAMSDYLGELLGPVTDKQDETSDPDKLLPDYLTREIIQPGHWLQPSINLQKRSPSLEQLVQASAENLIILLNLFYYMRRPIGQQVRLAMMDQCQELIMELKFYQQLGVR